jgi:peroxiredoxin
MANSNRSRSKVINLRRWKWVQIVAAIAAIPTTFVIGLYAFVAVGNAQLKPVQPDPGVQLIFREGKEHPVTPAMSEAAKELDNAQAPAFEATDPKGQKYSLRSLTNGKPLVLFFVELQCPCCKGAKPYIDRIQNYYGDVCNVVGVINAKPDVAQAWANVIEPQFPLMCDPEMHIIRSYKAERGVYTTLVSPDGRVVKAYPGYCQDMLKDITQKIAHLAGIKMRPMPLERAPKRMTSGCIFPGTVVPDDQL